MAVSKLTRSSIIRRMAKFKELYVLADYVSHQNKKIYSGHAYQATMENMVEGAGLVHREDCLRHYMQVRGVNRPEAKRVLGAAQEAGYIAHHKFGMTVDTLSVTPYEGENFLKRVGCVRLGMYRDIFNHYSPLTPIASLVLSALLSAAAILISVLVAKHVIK